MASAILSLSNKMTSVIKIVQKVNANINSIQELDEATLVLTSNNLTSLTPLGVTNIANIGNSATGTQIATAVNGILAALVSAGIMKAS